VLTDSHTLPIRCDGPVHRGKVRAVYWLTAEDSARLVSERQYAVAPTARLGVMVISDRISAYECIWRADGGLDGVPGKGAALNAISAHWFSLFAARGLAGSHILEVPHPLVWVVQRARPVLIEAIARQYITGSMWRAYAGGSRDFCGIALLDGLAKDSKLPGLLITPSTKGVLKGIPGVPEIDDVNVSRGTIEAHPAAFGFASAEHIAQYERLLSEGFEVIAAELAALDQIFVDTKFEFGYAADADGHERLIYMDEVGTPDSSRIWDGPAYRDGGRVVENSKECFRKLLQAHFAPDADVLLNKERMAERADRAAATVLPAAMLLEVSRVYTALAEKITGKPIAIPKDPVAEITAVLRDTFHLVDP